LKRKDTVRADGVSFPLFPPEIWHVRFRKMGERSAIRAAQLSSLLYRLVMPTDGFEPIVQHSHVRTETLPRGFVFFAVARVRRPPAGPHPPSKSPIRPHIAQGSS